MCLDRRYKGRGIEGDWHIGGEEIIEDPIQDVGTPSKAPGGLAELGTSDPIVRFALASLFCCIWHKRLGPFVHG